GGEVLSSDDGGLPGPSRVGNRGDLASAWAVGRTRSGSACERSPLPGGRSGLRGGPPDDGEVAGELPDAHRVGRREERGEERGLHVGAVRGNDRPVPPWPCEAGPHRHPGVLGEAPRPHSGPRGRGGVPDRRRRRGSTPRWSGEGRYPGPI